MTIVWRGRKFGFRECDVKGMTKAEVEAKAAEVGKMQYEPRAAWLVVKGIGYGWEVSD